MLIPGFASVRAVRYIFSLSALTLHSVEASENMYVILSTSIQTTVPSRPPSSPRWVWKSGDQSGIKFNDLHPEMFRASVQMLGEHRGDGHDGAQRRRSLLYFAGAAFSSCRRLQAAGCRASVVSEPCIQMMGFRSGPRLCAVYLHWTVIPQLDHNLCHLCV